MANPSSKTLLQLKSLFWNYQDSLWTGTASSGTSMYLADSVLQDVPDNVLPFAIEGKYVYITAGDSANDIRRIVRYDAGLGRMEPNRPFSTAPTTSSTYEVWGTSIHPADQLTRLFNYVLTFCRPVVTSKLTPLTDSLRWYDVSSLVDVPTDVLRVYVHRIDTGYQRPFDRDYIDSFRVHKLPVTKRTVAISGTPAGGTYSLTYNTTAATTALAYNLGSTSFQASMQTLIGSTSLSVATTGATPNFTHTVTFSGVAGTPWDLVALSSLLTGGSSPTVTVADAAGVQGIYLEIDPHMSAEKLVTGSTSMYQKELWLEHHKTLAAFSADTDTVESMYSEWLVHEALLAHAVRMGATGSSDAARWKALAEAEKHHVLKHRALHMPKKTQARHERPQYG